jgi:hypothetical protein
MQRVHVRTDEDGDWQVKPITASEAGDDDARPMADELVQAAQSIKRLARSMQATMETQRLQIAARLAGAERRETPRWTLIGPAFLTLDGEERAVTVCNISAEGLNVTRPAGVILPFEVLGLIRMADVGAWPVRVTALTLDRLALAHVAETMPVGVGARLERLLAAVEARNGAELRAVCATAAAAERALEELLAAGAISEAMLFAAALQPVEGSDPAQFRKPGARLIEQTLAPLLDHLDGVLADPASDICALDAHGHRAAQDRRHAAPQRADAPLANAHLSRNLTYDHSLLAAAAAKLSPDPLLHTAERTLDLNHGRLARTASAPVRIGGRRWGAVQAAWFGDDAAWIRRAAGSAEPSPA